MLYISQSNKDAVTGSGIAKKEDFLFLSEHIVSCIKTNNKPNRLYNAFASAQSVKTPDARPETTALEGMKRHKGYPENTGHLTDIQRNALNRVNAMKSGDFTAIMLSDITLKYQTIKNVIYNSYITEALGDGVAPVIVYAGDDASVFGMLNSFNMLEKNEQQDNILYKHWLQGISSSAAYINNGYTGADYQHVTKSGNGFINSAETHTKIEENKKLMLYNCYLLFNTTYTDLTSCKEALYTRLYQLEDTKIRILDTVARLADNDINMDFINKKTHDLRREIEERISLLNTEALKTRLDQWKEYFDNKPGGLTFLPNVKKKIKDRFNHFITQEEKAFINETMTYDDVEKIYNEKIEQKDAENTEALAAEKLKLSFFALLDILKKNNTDIEDKIKRCDIDEINGILDSTVRYNQVWYAIHYYECRWLIGEFSLKDTVRFSMTKETLEKRYRRLAMITPCLAMKFEDLPDNFFAFVSDDKPTFPLCDFIDLLIIDNADTIDAGIAACTFYLAKKAVAIGSLAANEKSLLGKAGAV